MPLHYYVSFRSKGIVADIDAYTSNAFILERCNSLSVGNRYGIVRLLVP